MDGLLSVGTAFLAVIGVTLMVRVIGKIVRGA
jgi:hypothetical protein